MAVSYTPEQRAAIEKREADILVSAAAGSGKTAVLVERILSMLIEGSADIDELLCLTFTEAAASEMREKIYNKITEYTEAHPDDTRMAQQLKRLRKADISTIDSFIASVVKSHYHLVDIDPNYRIITGGEVLQLQLEVLDEIFAKKYAAQDKDFFALIEDFCPRTEDRPLKDLILEVYGYAVSMPYPKKWLTECTKRFDIDKNADLSQTEWGQHIIKLIKTNAAQISELANRADSICGGIPAFAELIGLADLIADRADKDIFALRRYVHEQKLTKPKKAEMKPAGEDADILAAMFERASAAFDDTKDLLDSLPLDNWQDNIIALKPTVEALVSLVLEFSDKYIAKKKEERLAEFDDISHFALEILLDENGKPTAAANSYKQQYKEIIIDEYQDCNFLQDTALEAVSRKSLNKPNRFMVGDIKQCIYKFRKANPEIFAKKYSEFGGEDSSQCLIRLNKNFRSRKNILDTCNFFFTQLMTKAFGDVDYNEDVALNCGANYSDADKKTDAVEVCLINTSGINKDERFDAIPENGTVSTACEAIYTANRIKELLDSGFLVEDPHKGTKRPAEPRDIVILFRTRKPLPVFSAILGYFGIPVMTEQTISLFDALEVSMLVSFLRAIDNPLQDIHLLTMLFSPVYNITPNELVMLGSKENNYLYENVCEYERNHTDELSAKLAHFLDDLKYFTQLSRRLVPINELLKIIFDRTGLYSYVSLLSGGNMRRQNLDALFNIALEYDKVNAGSLYDFVAHLDMLAAAGVKKDASPTAQTNSVTAMTMHQSKGLEFPIVFLPQMCARFKHNSGVKRSDPSEVAKNKNIALSQDLGIGMKLIDPDRRVVSNTLTNVCIASHAELDEMRENLRILYVAMTRAKQKLFMVGATVGAKMLSRALSYVTYSERALPLGYMQNASYYMDWLLTCLARSNRQPSIHLRSNSLFSCNYINDFDFNCNFYFYDSENFYDLIGQAQAKDTAKEDMAAVFEKLDSAEKSADVSKILGWVYPHSRTAALPSKTSISEIKHRWQEDEENNLIQRPEPIKELTLPDFAKTKIMTGAARGTLYHTFMEHIDFSFTADDIDEYKNQLVKDGIFTVEEANVIDNKKIAAFLDSDICRRIRNSKNVKRETAFTLGLTPYELYRDDIYKDDKELIHVDGIIDLFFEEDGNIVLLDYKTDRIGEGGIKAIADRYKIQLDLYAVAIERATGKKVTEKLLYLFSADTVLAV